MFSIRRAPTGGGRLEGMYSTQEKNYILFLNFI